MCKLKAGQTVVQANSEVLDQAAAGVLDLRHVLCGQNGNSFCPQKICVRTEMLSAHLTVTKGTTQQLATDVYATTFNVAGKLLYQPVNGCGVNPSSSAPKCADEDVIFASFKIYSNVDDIEVTACDAAVNPITHSNCQDFTSEVLISLPYSVSSASNFGKKKS